MVAKFLGRAMVLLAGLPAAAFALGLGDIRLNSTLNAPLDAEIELLEATPEELNGLKAGLASRDTFTRYGLDWPQFLASVKVRVTQGSDGRSVLKVTSAQTITEPFVTMLIEVNWARGRLVREYTVLLDPPVFTPNQQASSSAPVSAPTTGSTRSGQIDRPAVSTTAAGGDSYRVQRGDYLSRIARQYAGGSNSERLMVGIYRANPDAFNGNMNELRAGTVLRIPDSGAVAAIGASEASAEIRSQYASWAGRNRGTGSTSGDRLRLVTPGEPGGETISAGGAEAASLQARVAELESQLAESRRLLDLKNAELAKLQSQLGGAAEAEVSELQGAAAGAGPGETEAAVSEQPAEPAEQVAAGQAGAGEETTPEATAPSEAEQQAAAEVGAPGGEPAEQAPGAVTRRPTPPVEDSGGGILDLLKSFWWVPALLIAALLGLFGWRKYRERAETDSLDSLGRLGSAAAEPVGFGDGRVGDTSNMTGVREQPFVVEESGTHEQPRIDATGEFKATTVRADDTISGETAISLDQGDPLADADFHMAYGLYDQAADLVRIAIAREPERRDLKLKLLEIFFVWGNKDQFLATARELDGSRAEAGEGEWDKVVIMGKQIAPEDPLFAGAASSGAAAGGLDIDLVGGDAGALDFDLAGAEASQLAPGPDVDMDFASALGDKDPTGESKAVSEDDLDFVFDGAPESTGDTARNRTENLRSGSTTTNRTVEMPADELPAGGDDFDLDFGLDDSQRGDTAEQPSPFEASEAPTVEQPALTNTGATIQQKVEFAIKSKSNAGDETAELAIDDLGLDVGALEAELAGDDDDAEVNADTPTMVAGLDEKSRTIMERAAARSMSETDFDPNATASLRQMDDADDASSTARLRAMGANGSDIDLDLDVGEHAAGATHTNGLDLDVGAAEHTSDVQYTKTQRVTADSLALPDLDPVTMSEVGTKLDLARAYMDMGDPDGARNILEEVLHEGSVSQKQEAQRLIESLPG
ncbi:MAG: FimV/HubP family polar landmark protein [Steroidobacteraceae bacterium]